VQTLWGSRILDIAVGPMPWIFELMFHVKILTFVLDENRLAAVVNTVRLMVSLVTAVVGPFIAVPAYDESGDYESKIFPWTQIYGWWEGDKNMNVGLGPRVELVARACE
jgi:hypothetical protein